MQNEEKQRGKEKEKEKYLGRAGEGEMPSSSPPVSPLPSVG